jgi:TRAP-type transport system periplasmic protein
MRRLITALSILLLAASAFCGRVSAATWQCYTYDAAATDPVYQELAKLAEQIQQATGGKISVACHPGGALPINVENIAQSISQNVLQFGLVDSLSYNGLVPPSAVLSLPGLFSSEADLNATVKALTPALRKAFAARNTMMLGIASYPLQVIWSTQKVTSLADLKGATVRVTSAQQAAFVKEFGGTPISLGMPDVPTALQRGMVQDVLTSNVGGGLVWHGLLHYNLRTGPNYVTIMLLANKQQFDALPAAEQQKIEALSATAAQTMTQLLQGRERALTPQFEKDGLIVTRGTPADAADIKQRMQPFWAQWAKQQGPAAQQMLSQVEAVQKQSH